MKEIYSNKDFKVMRVVLPKGKQVPAHHASEDVFVIVDKGSAILKMDESNIKLEAGATQLIPANKAHKLEISDDFSACIITKKESVIEFESR